MLIIKYTNKKRDCTVAVPLLEAFALPNHIEQQREAHADMYEDIYTFIVHMVIDIHIPRTSYVAMFCYGYESCEVSIFLRLGNSFLFRQRRFFHHSFLAVTETNGV